LQRILCQTGISQEFTLFQGFAFFPFPFYVYYFWLHTPMHNLFFLLFYPNAENNFRIIKRTPSQRQVLGRIIEPLRLPPVRLRFCFLCIFDIFRAHKQKGKPVEREKHLKGFLIKKFCLPFRRAFVFEACLKRP